MIDVRSGLGWRQASGRVAAAVLAVMLAGGAAQAVAPAAAYAGEAPAQGAATLDDGQKAASEARTQKAIDAKKAAVAGLAADDARLAIATADLAQRDVALATATASDVSAKADVARAAVAYARELAKAQLGGGDYTGLTSAKTAYERAVQREVLAAADVEATQASIALLQNEKQDVDNKADAASPAEAAILRKISGLLSDRISDLQDALTQKQQAFSRAAAETEAARNAYLQAIRDIPEGTPLGDAARELESAQEAAAKTSRALEAAKAARSASSQLRDEAKADRADAKADLEAAQAELDAADKQYYELHTAWARFTDVDEGDWYVYPGGQLDYVVDRGIMGGYGNGVFGPYDYVTRGQAVTILWRMAGSPSADAERFSDVDYGQFYGGAVSWARATGLVDGIGGNRFAPDARVSRQDLCVMMRNYASKIAHKDVSPAGSTASSNRGWDQVAGYARDAVAWVDKAGIMKGKGVEGSLDIAPNDPTWRASMVKMAAELDKLVKE